jgi:hypothetical protein
MSRMATKGSLVALIVTIVAGAVDTGALARVGQSARARPATASGWVIFTENPPRPQGSRRNGTVIVRTANGRIVTRARATKRQGFNLSLPPGPYELNAIVLRGTNKHLLERDCPAETKVILHVGKNAPIYLYVGCPGTTHTPPGLGSPPV